jgi:hypothetical protein
MFQPPCAPGLSSTPKLRALRPLINPPRAPRPETRRGVSLCGSQHLIDAVSAWSACAIRASRFTRVPLAAVLEPGKAADCVVHARRLAIHLATVELGVSHHELCRASGIPRQTIDDAAEDIGDRRDDDAALDRAIDQMGAELRRYFGMLAAPAANDNAQLHA